MRTRLHASYEGTHGHSATDVVHSRWEVHATPIAAPRVLCTQNLDLNHSRQQGALYIDGGIEQRSPQVRGTDRRVRPQAERVMRHRRPPRAGGDV